MEWVRQMVADGAIETTSSSIADSDSVSSSVSHSTLGTLDSSRYSGSRRSETSNSRRSRRSHSRSRGGSSRGRSKSRGRKDTSSGSSRTEDRLASSARAPTAAGASSAPGAVVDPKASELSTPSATTPGPPSVNGASMFGSIATEEDAKRSLIREIKRLERLAKQSARSNSKTGEA